VDGLSLNVNYDDDESGVDPKGLFGGEQLGV